jgi:predicted nucleic acid-binding protein
VPRYLADTSIWSWAGKRKRPDITRKLEQRVAGDELVTCVPVALEVMHRAETGARYEQQFTTVLDPLEWVPLTEEASWRALDVQRLLAAESRGAHRLPPTDFLIAAVAELRGDLILWCFDKHFRPIADLTGQPLEEEISTGPGH